MEVFIVDTNILLDYPNFIESKKNNSKIYIIAEVLKELDGLKGNINPETAYKARRAAIVLSRNLKNLCWYSSDYSEYKNLSTDDKLVYVTKRLNGTLVTNDVYLKIKCYMRDINTCGYSNNEDLNYGTVEISFDLDENGYNSDLDYILQNLVIPNSLNIKLNNNNYIILKNKNDNEVFGAYLYNNGKLEQIELQRDFIRNKFIDKIRPLNAEQSCLFHALKCKDNTILYAGGVYGSGKSFILNNFALQELENQSIKKIVYVPNNSYTENTLETGFLPGELIDKILGQIGPLIDLVGIDTIHRMIAEEQLEVVPMSTIRGRSFQDSIIIVNESQNLTEDHIKLLIARCGNGTRIFFDGDIKQADSQLFRDKNGLKLLLNLQKSEEYSKIFAAIKLTTVERSHTARAAEYLDSCVGGF